MAILTRDEKDIKQIGGFVENTSNVELQLNLDKYKIAKTGSWIRGN